jgi:hypothetical protein
MSCYFPVRLHLLDPRQIYQKLSFHSSFILPFLLSKLPKKTAKDMQILIKLLLRLLTSQCSNKLREASTAAYITPPPQTKNKKINCLDSSIKM